MQDLISELFDSIFIKIPLGLRIAGVIDIISFFFTALSKKRINEIYPEKCDETRYLEDNYYQIQLSFELLLFILSIINLVFFSFFFYYTKRNNEFLNIKFFIVNMTITVISFAFSFVYFVIIINVFSKCKENNKSIKINQKYPISFNFIINLLEYLIDLFNLIKQRKINKKLRTPQGISEIEVDETIENIILTFDNVNIEKKKSMINKLREKKRKLEEKYRNVENKYNEIENLNNEIYRNSNEIERLKKNLQLFDEYEPSFREIKKLKEDKKKEINDIINKKDEAETLILTWSTISNDVIRLTALKDNIRRNNEKLNLKHKFEEKKLNIKKLKDTLDDLKKKKNQIEFEFKSLQIINNEIESNKKKIIQLKEFLQLYEKNEEKFITIRKLKKDITEEINNIKKNEDEGIILEWCLLTNEVAKLTQIKDSIKGDK